MTEITNSGQIDQKFAIGFLLAFALTVAIFLILQISSVNEQVSLSFAHPTDNTSGKRSVDDKLAVEAVKGIKQFSSEEDFKKFLADAQMTKGSAGGFGAGIGGGELVLDSAQPLSANKAAGSATAAPVSASGSAPQRGFRNQCPGFGHRRTGYRKKRRKKYLLFPAHVLLLDRL